IRGEDRARAAVARREEIQSQTVLTVIRAVIKVRARAHGKTSCMAGRITHCHVRQRHTRITEDFVAVHAEDEEVIIELAGHPYPKAEQARGEIFCYLDPGGLVGADGPCAQ